jgi:hypothetical protein
VLSCLKRIIWLKFRWTVNNAFSLVCGAILSAVVAYFTIAIPAYRKGLKLLFLGSTEESEDRMLTWKENIFYFLYYCLYSVLHIASMMLIMTMNGTVLVFMFLGYSLAFVIFGLDCDRDKTLPVNCCA